MSVTNYYHELVCAVCSTFGTDMQAIIGRIVVEEKFVRDDELSETLGLSQKQVRSVLNVLKQERMLKSELVAEKNEEGRTRHHNLWYVDYHEVIDVIRYKLFMLKRELEKHSKRRSSLSMFRCTNPKCQKEYSLLDVSKLFNPGKNAFVCSSCGSNLGEVSKQNDNDTLVKAKEDYYDQLIPLEELLQNALKTEPPRYKLKDAGGNEGEYAGQESQEIATNTARGVSVGYQPMESMIYDRNVSIVVELEDEDNEIM